MTTKDDHDMKNAMLCAWTLSLAVTLASCAAESYQRVPSPSQSVEVTSPAVSRIYLLRMPQAKGLIRGLTAKENDRDIGRIGRNNYLCWERPPGRSLVVITYEGSGFGKDDRESMIDVEAEAGRAYYYGVSVDETWDKGIVKLLSRDEAREILNGLEAAPKD
jgi:hypothetical protein